MSQGNGCGTRDELVVEGRAYAIHSLPRLAQALGAQCRRRAHPAAVRRRRDHGLYVPRQPGAGGQLGRAVLSIAGGVDPAALGSHIGRRGNHEVMVRATFANPRLRNELLPACPGGLTRHLLDGAELIGLAAGLSPGMAVAATIRRPGGRARRLALRARIDARREADWVRHSGILPYVTRDLLAARPEAAVAS